MHSPVPTSRLAYRLLVVGALLVYFALALDTAGSKAITTDEPLHLTHSIVMLETSFMRIPEMHTPLTYRLVGGLLATEPHLPDVTALETWPTLNAYDISRELIWRDDIAADRVVWLGRFIVVAVGVVLGASMAAWIASLTHSHRPTIAIVLALFALSPNLLAAAALVTTDIAATLTWFLSTYTWWRYWQRPGWGRWLAAAASLGLALSAKLTGVLVLPVTFVLAFANPQPDKRWWRPGLVWAGMLPVAGLILWAGYAFEMRGALPMPEYVDAWRLLLREVDISHVNFFMGRVSLVGSWFYLPATLLLKTPLLQLALFILIPFVLWWERRRWRSLIFLLFPAVFFMAVAAVSRLNFGYRHALPAVPYLMLLGALAIPHLWPRRAARAALLAALGWTTISALILHPDHLTYFNELALGRGYRYLGDSNLDWGQDLNLLADYAGRYRSETGRPLFFSYTGAAVRDHYGLSGPSLIEQFNQDRRSFAPANPAPGRYAINAGDLQGTGLVLGELRESALFDWFRRQEPVATLGGSIFIYDVPRQADGTWVSHCVAPGRLLDNEQAEFQIGRRDLRHVEFDCRTSWIFPADGGPGWYVLPPDGMQWIETWLTKQKPVEVYHHRANEFGPEFIIAYWPGMTSITETGDEIVEYSDQSRGPAQLRGYGARGSEWITLWQVASATADPLSVKAHLFAGEEPPQVADGLGYSAEQWRPGDWFIQRHTFNRPGDRLETDLYNYITLEPVTERVTLPTP